MAEFCSCARMLSVDSGYSPAAAGMLARSQNPAQPLFDQLHQIRSRPDDGRRLWPDLPRHDSSVEGIGSTAAPVRRQQAPVSVVTSTRLAHGQVVDFGYGPGRLLPAC